MDKAIYQLRRKQFMDRMGDGVAIFPAAPERRRSNDVDHRYRQNNDLYYLTGFPEPEALCVLSPLHDSERFILFVRPRDREKEVWNGKRLGVEGAMEVFGADAAYPVDKLNDVLPPHLQLAERVYFDFGGQDQSSTGIVDLINRSRGQRARSGKGVVALVDPGEILHEMRLVKAPVEIDLMRRAAAISESAHRAAMRRILPEMYEYEIEALLEYNFRSLGGMGPAYPSIVASGANATVLHYTTNDRRMERGDLVLIDAGAEVGCYCSDVTRTFPVATKYSSPQRDIYEVVLHAQKETIATIRPGIRFDDIHRRATEILVDGLLGLQLLHGNKEQIIEKQEHQRFYMHRTSHWLGMDVHDVGNYRVAGESRVLEPGMVLTVEPGIYIAADMTEVRPEYRGIGVRIEDDVLVTAEGHDILTGSIPKEVHEIEALRMAGEG